MRLRKVCGILEALKKGSMIWQVKIKKNENYFYKFCLVLGTYGQKIMRIQQFIISYESSLDNQMSIVRYILTHMTIRKTSNTPGDFIRRFDH